MSVTLTLVVRPAFDAEAFLRAVAEEATGWRRTPNALPPEEIVEAAGRICYMSFGERQSPRTNPIYIRHLVEMGHESVLEHVVWGFVLTGVSRAFSHQLVRHRPGWSYSQLSQQYHDEKDAKFVEPEALKASPEARAIWRQAMDTAKRSYRDILAILEGADVVGSAGEKKELKRALYSAARSVLPNATETKLFVSANARAIRHFLAVRGALLGDEEMRRVSAVLLATLSAEAPALFADFAIETLADGSPMVVRRAP